MTLKLSLADAVPGVVATAQKHAGRLRCIQRRQAPGNCGLRYASFTGVVTASEYVLLQRSTGRILVLAIAATLVAAIIAYAAASVTAYAVQPFTVRPAKTIVITAEPQMANRTAKADRMALLLELVILHRFQPFAPCTRHFIYHGCIRPARGPVRNFNRSSQRCAARGDREQAEVDPTASGILACGSSGFAQHRPQIFSATPTASKEIDVNSAEVQWLIETATPLILLLSEDQKREVRHLVRLVGLEIVASRI